MKRSGWWLAMFLSVVLGLAVESPARGQHEPEPVVNPRTDRSASGRFVFTTVPGQRLGIGPARYRLTARGEDGAEREIWAGERPFTLREAVVADDGSVAGYAYTLGRDGENWERRGEFLVVFLGPSGTVRRIERNPRRTSMTMHAPPEPTVEDGLTLDAAHDRLLVRLSPSFWRVYRVSDGRFLGRTDASRGLPEATMRSGALYATGARLVPGTGLMLVQWCRYADHGARFALVDPAPPGRMVWHLELPREPVTKSDRENALEPVLDALVPTDEPSRFALWLAGSGERVEYAVVTEAGSRVGARGRRWRVREVSREPTPAPTVVSRDGPPPPTPVLREGRLSALGSFTLAEPGGGPPPTIRSICGFDLDGRGRPGFLRVEAGRADFVLVNPEDGSIMREMDLAEPARLGIGFNAGLHLAWIGPDERWLMTATPGKGKTAGWFLDAGTGALTAVENFDCPTVRSLAGAGDGRFVVLRLLSPDQLVGFDPDGKMQWTVEGTYETLFSPQEVTVLEGDAGKVAAVVEAVGQHVGFFDLNDGRLLRRVDLKQVLGREPNYPAGICPDEAGGCLVQDFNGTAPYLRLTAAGTLRGPLTPRGADGRPFNGRDLRREPDAAGGRLWTVDGDSLVRLSADGATVDRTLGTPAGSGRLTRVDALTVGDDGRTYAVDGRSGVVHVFDAAGHPERRLRPDPGDFPADPVASRDLAPAFDGRVFLGLNYGWDEPFGHARVEFGPGGERVGVHRLPSRGGEEKSHRQLWRFLPTGGGEHGPEASGTLLLVGDEEITLTSLSAGAPSRIVDHQPDGRWLESADSVSVAPDGSFAVACRPVGRFGGPWTVNVFAPDGTGQRTVPMPEEFDNNLLAYNGRHFATRQGGRLAVFDATTGAGVLASTPTLLGGLSLEHGSWGLFSVRGGRELWLVESDTRTVVRFAWPE